LSQSKPFGVRIFWISRKFKEGLEMLVPFALVRADECANGFWAPAVDIAEQPRGEGAVSGAAEMLSNRSPPLQTSSPPTNFGYGKSGIGDWARKLADWR
jgi:hypothetical protein